LMRACSVSCISASTALPEACTKLVWMAWFELEIFQPVAGLVELHHAVRAGRRCQRSFRRSPVRR
jgi:hypothetical protein